MGHDSSDESDRPKSNRRGKRSSKRDRSMSENSDRSASDRRRASTLSPTSGEETDPPVGLQKRCRGYYRDETDESEPERETVRSGTKGIMKSPKTPKNHMLSSRYNDELNSKAQSTPRKKPKSGKILTIKSSKKSPARGDKKVTENAVRRLKKMGIDTTGAKKIASMLFAEKKGKRDGTRKRSKVSIPSDSDSGTQDSSVMTTDDENGLNSTGSENEPERTVSFEPRLRTEEPKKVPNTIARNPSFTGAELDTGRSIIKLPNPANPKSNDYSDYDVAMALTVAHTHMANAPPDFAVKNISRARNMMIDATVIYWDKCASEEELKRRYPKIAESKPQAQPFRPALKGKWKSLNQGISASVCAKPFESTPGETAQLIQDLVTFSRAKPDDVVRSLNKLFSQKSKIRISYRVKKKNFFCKNKRIVRIMVSRTIMMIFIFTKNKIIFSLWIYW